MKIIVIVVDTKSLNKDEHFRKKNEIMLQLA